ncbi:MAG: nucleotidyltransferase family protein [Puniceicoccales bacterium]|nr:nucleotidyltransferase family protein [Puniceicoccales bacterium]
MRGFHFPSYVAYLRRALRCTRRDELLLELAVGEEFSKQRMAQLFHGLDIAAEGYRFNLLLALVCEGFAFRAVPAKFEPRLRGIIRYYRFQNTAQLVHFSRLGKVCNGHAIPLLLLKGVALRALDEKNRPRVMGDVDFAVPRASHEAVLLEAKQLGFRITHVARHAVDMRCADCCIDVHRSIFHDSPRPEAEEVIWQRARPMRAYGVAALVPCAEDLLLSLVCNEFRNVLCSDRDLQYFQWLHDCAFLLKRSPGFSWDLLLATAEQIGIAARLKPMVAILASLLPALVPGDLPRERWELNDAEAKGVGQNLIIHATSLKNWERKRLRLRACRSLRDLRHYFSTKIKYRMLKLARRWRPLRGLAISSILRKWKR